MEESAEEGWNLLQRRFMGTPSQSSASLFRYPVAIFLSYDVCGGGGSGGGGF